MSALGVCIGAGMAHSETNQPVPYSLVDPQVTSSNRHVFLKEIERWQHDMNRISRYHERGRISDQLLDRAYFAAGAIDIVVAAVENGECCQIMSCDQHDHILGVSQYELTHYSDVVRCSIVYQAIEPMHLRDAPSQVKVRGVGSGLLAAVALMALHAGATEMMLTPLDYEARAFWLRRGFQEDRFSGKGLWVQGVPQIQKLLGDCLPSRGGDFLVCREISASQVASICR